MDDKSVEFKIISTRKIVDVKLNHFREHSDAPEIVEVDMCTTCYAIVGDPMDHDHWHREQDKKD